MSTVEIVAGSEAGHKDGAAGSCQFRKPQGVASDGKRIFVTDHENHCIRQIENGTVSTIAGKPGTSGYQDGPAASSLFNWPTSIILCGEYLIIADTHNNRIRKLSLATQEVTTVCGDGTAGFKDGESSVAQFNFPQGVCVQQGGANLLVADTYNCRIRQVDMNSGAVSTFAGTGEVGFSDGTAKTSLFDNPQDVACDPEGNVYIADTDNNRIRLVIADGTVTTYAGDGEAAYGDGDAAEAQFCGPSCLVADAAGFVYVADSDNNMIRAISPTGQVSTVAGDVEEGCADGPALEAKFFFPKGICYDAESKTILVADSCNNKVRRIRIVFA